MEQKYSTREDWLVAACEKIKKHFNWFEFPDNVKVSVGVCKGKAIGTCFNPSQSEDKFNHIFIDAGEGNPSRVIDILIHELVHAHLNNTTSDHRGARKRLCGYCGTLWSAKTNESNHSRFRIKSHY